MGELEALQERKIGLSSQVLDGLPKGNVAPRIDTKWLDLMDYNDEIIDYLTLIVQDMKEDLEVVVGAVNKLPEREKAVLTARYIRGMSFREIEKIVPCTDRTMYNILRSGLELIELPLDEE